MITNLGASYSINNQGDRYLSTQVCGRPIIGALKLVRHQFSSHSSLEDAYEKIYTIYTMRTSYSVIDTYLRCPQQYKFQEIDRIRAPKSREAIFGSLVHDTLEFMFSRTPLYPTLDEVVAYFREHWPTREVFLAESKNDPLKRPWNADEEKAFFEEGVRMLRKFYEKNAPWNYVVVDLESRFEVALTDDKTGETHILAGIIDRIDKLPDDTYEIIDYKTGKRMPSQDALNRDLQLSLYSLGLQNRWPHLKPEDIKLSLYFLKHDEKLTAKPAPDATEKIKKHVLKTINEIKEKIKTGKDFEPMPSILCNWCGYRPMCPAWKHLYKNQNPGIANQVEENAAVNEYLALKKSEKKIKDRMDDLHGKIEAYMEREGLTRLFGDEGYLSKKKQQRYAYDEERVKALLSPFGKWEDVLDMDTAKLKKILYEVPEEVRIAIEEARAVAKEYTVITASLKKIKGPEDAAEENHQERA